VNPSPILPSQILALPSAVLKLRRASFEDIEALAGGLPMLSQRSYRIGSEQGIVVLKAAVIDQQYQWVVTLEVSITVGTDDVAVVPREVVRTHRPAGGSEGNRRTC
jgi:hypothetical protein